MPALQGCNYSDLPDLEKGRGTDDHGSCSEASDSCDNFRLVKIMRMMDGELSRVRPARRVPGRRARPAWRVSGMRHAQRTRGLRKIPNNLVQRHVDYVSAYRGQKPMYAAAQAASAWARRNAKTMWARQSP